jgi:hypothetical protein
LSVLDRERGLEIRPCPERCGFPGRTAHGSTIFYGC